MNFLSHEHANLLIDKIYTADKFEIVLLRKLERSISSL